MIFSSTNPIWSIFKSPKLSIQKRQSQAKACFFDVKNPFSRARCEYFWDISNTLDIQKTQFWKISESADFADFLDKEFVQNHFLDLSQKTLKTW